MDGKQALRFLNGFNEAVQAHKEELSLLDTPIGDGDHGSNLARGMQAVMDAVASDENAPAADLFKKTAMALISKVGGASGPLYGSAFLGMSKAAAAGKSDGEIMEAGLEQILKRGKASVGDKTMVDVWTPAIEALKAGNLTDEKIEEYVLATKDMQARKGRASYLGERSIGHIDPGSRSSGYLFESLLASEKEA